MNISRLVPFHIPPSTLRASLIHHIYCAISRLKYSYTTARLLACIYGKSELVQ